MKRLASFVIAICATALAATSATATDANGNHETYKWIVGATTGSATAAAPNGSTITMKGSGVLMAGPGGTATGGGTFTRSSGGSGRFTVTGIDGFVSYGSAPPSFPIAGATGGETKLHVSLSDGTSGTLTIICELGSPPPSKMEGIQVILGSGGTYTDQVRGNTVFILVS